VQDTDTCPHSAFWWYKWWWLKSHCSTRKK